MPYANLKKNSLLVTKEPLAGADFTTILQLLAQNYFKISIRYIPRVIYSLFLSSVLSPFRLKEHVKYDKRIRETSISLSPLFLLGHWRGGTTYLHNLLSKDSQFGYFSTFDAYVPGVFLTSEQLIKPIVAASLPTKRPMDDVIMGADLPQEEEYALGGSSIYSYYNGWIFPKNMGRYNQYVTLDHGTPKDVSNFKKDYLQLIKKATIKNQGHRLLLKNPSNTARIKILLELFPDAKFVHIQRNPYHQYLSMLRFMSIVIPFYCVQNPPPLEEINEHLLNLYEQMYRKYFKERSLVPDGNLVEIRYEDFISDPLAETKKIYQGLNLEGFEQVSRKFHAYILSQSEIRQASYSITYDIREQVYSRWSFAFDQFGYPR